MNLFSRLLIRSLPLAVALGAWPALAAPTTPYPQPDPSNEEQALLEMINRARADPPAEGAMLAAITDQTILNNYTFFHVDTAALIRDFADYAAQPPLALNPQLMTAARAHSLDMAASGIQQHNGTDGSTFDDRISATGYQWAASAENIYTWVSSPFFAHAGFNVDWGVPSLDHRVNIMGLMPDAPVFREVGVSYVATVLPGFGPFVVTQDFATPADATVAYVVGVVYADDNANGAYDQGEGLADVTVQPDQGDYYAVTATAGGFVIPLPTSGAGVLTIAASGGALGEPRTKTIAWTAGTNVKVDFTPADSVTPVVTLSVSARNVRGDTGRTGLVTISRMGGDTSRPLRVALLYKGTAVGDVDYAALPSMVSIPAGADSVDLAVEGLGGNAERKELGVRISHRTRYVVSDGFAWSWLHILPSQ